MNNLVIMAVYHFGGVWPCGYYDRYLHWDDTLGWNMSKGDAIYYGEFECKCSELGFEFSYPEKPII